VWTRERKQSLRHVVHGGVHDRCSGVALHAASGDLWLPEASEPDAACIGCIMLSTKRTYALHEAAVSDTSLLASIHTSTELGTSALTCLPSSVWVQLSSMRC
jgi:hypothetical protein